MTALTALALIATAAPQGVIGPVTFPTGPITWPRFILVNQIANGGFEASSMSPWQTGGQVKYWDKSPDGTSAILVGQSIQGEVTNGTSNTGNKAFRMKAEYPGYVLQGSGYSAVTYVQQSLSTPIYGSGVFAASAWVNSDYSTGLTVEIEYTAGAPTVGTWPAGGGGWQKWDFRGAIDPARVVKAVRFRATAYSNGPGGNAPAFIDDVNVSILVRI